MSDACDNNCVTPADFPRSIFNRPGLERIDYRIGGYGDLLAAMLDGINQEPILRAWTHRAPDDPAIALLEGAAVVGDILTFYQQLYANEAYLRTARWRESIGDLVRLLGYRLAPGLGGQATFAFSVRGEQPIPIPAGFPLKAQVTGLDSPAVFETSVESTAVPGLSKFNLYRPFTYPLFGTAVTLLTLPSADLQAAGLKLEPKDRLMLLDTDASATTRHQIVIVKKVETQADRTHITIEGSYSAGNGLAAVKAYKLGKTYRHFGHNAPPQVTKINGSSVTQVNISYERSPNGLTTSDSTTTIAPPISPTQIPLDQPVDGLAVGSTVLIEGANQGSAVVARKITAIRAASLTWGALTGATTLLSVDQKWEANYNPPVFIGGGTYSYSYSIYFFTDIRQLAIHETAGPALTLRPAPVPDPAADGSSLMFFGPEADYQQLRQRKLALLRPDGKLFETVANLPPDALRARAAGPAAFRPISLAPPLQADFSLADFPLDGPTVSVYGNLVEATQGKTESSTVLGSGDARQPFQQFKLPKAPLTYLIQPGSTPPQAPELQIWVENRRWQRVDSLFGQAPTAAVYIVREDLQGDSWVQFGDGLTGRRLPSGIANVSAKYRTGTGAYGGLKPETTVQAAAKLDQLDKVYLPGIASGGAGPESGDNARQAAPGKLQSLDRLVSLQDFESEALAIPGVAKVKALWGLVDSIPGVVLTVLMETGRAQELAQVRAALAKTNRCRGPQRYPVHVVAGQRLYIWLSADVAFDPTYAPEQVTQAVQAALGASLPLPAGQSASRQPPGKGLFALNQRAFGEPEYATRIAGVIQAVPGVQWTQVKQLSVLGEADDPAALDPVALRLRRFLWLRAPAVLPCDSGHILSLYAAHARLNPVSLPATEVC